ASAAHRGTPERTPPPPLPPPRAMPPLPRSLVLFTVLALAQPCRAAEPEDHWAFQPAKRPTAPREGNPIDAFVRAKLKAAGLEPAPRAPREQLIRRVTFDLTGLPPTPEEIDAFVNDKSADAWEKVIDRLLASPR